MNENGFRDWLENIDKRPLEQIRDNVARAKRVYKAFHVNLDVEYANNRCENLLNKLGIENRNELMDLRLPIDTSGLSSLKTALRKYVKYKDYLK